MKRQHNSTGTKHSNTQMAGKAGKRPTDCKRGPMDAHREAGAATKGGPADEIGKRPCNAEACGMEINHQRRCVGKLGGWWPCRKSGSTKDKKIEWARDSDELRMVPLTQQARHEESRTEGGVGKLIVSKFVPRKLQQDALRTENLKQEREKEEKRYHIQGEEEGWDAMGDFNDF